jgi:hypothetical protein
MQRRNSSFFISGLQPVNILYGACPKINRYKKTPRELVRGVVYRSFRLFYTEDKGLAAFVTELVQSPYGNAMHLAWFQILKRGFV